TPCKPESRCRIRNGPGRTKPCSQPCSRTGAPRLSGQLIAGERNLRMQGSVAARRGLGWPEASSGEGSWLERRASSVGWPSGLRERSAILITPTPDSVLEQETGIGWPDEPTLRISDRSRPADRGSGLGPARPGSSVSRETSADGRVTAEARGDRLTEGKRTGQKGSGQKAHGRSSSAGVAAGASGEARSFGDVAAGGRDEPQESASGRWESQTPSIEEGSHARLAPRHAAVRGSAQGRADRP